MMDEKIKTSRWAGHPVLADDPASEVCSTPGVHLGPPVRVHCPLLSLWETERRLMIQCAEAWGVENQLWQAAEEASELITSLSHLRRCREGQHNLDRLKVLHEIVDTINMCHEVMTILDITAEEYNYVYAEKLTKLKENYAAWERMETKAK